MLEPRHLQVLVGEALREKPPIIVKYYRVKDKLETIKEAWRTVEGRNKYPVLVRFDNAVVEIKPECTEFECKGSVRILDGRGREVAYGVLSSGVLKWFLGDVLHENNVVKFIKYFKGIRAVSKVIKPIINLLPAGGWRNKWEIYVSLETRGGVLPPYIGLSKDEYDYVLRLEC